MIKLPSSGGTLLLAPDHREWAEASLSALSAFDFGKDAPAPGEVAAREPDENFWSEYANTWMERYRPYNVRDGVLHIPVKGLLMKGLPFALGGFATGYEYIEQAVLRGAADPEVVEMVLDVNSPGGFTPGCFDCADLVYETRGSKPIRAFANEFAFSAAYAIASAADTVNVARTGGVGSIGVLATHVEESKALEDRGIKVTLVYAGERKADGHPAIPLSEDAKREIEERVAHIYGIFVSTVARNRGLDEQAVRGTEAASFLAPKAVEIGLADAVGPLDESSAQADPTTTNDDDDEEEEMTQKNVKAGTASAPSGDTVDTAAHEAAVQAARQEGIESGKAEGATQERARVSAILDCEEAKARPAAARQVALHTDLDTEAAAKFLAGLPEETPATTGKAAANGFEQAMENSGNPNVGADAGGDTAANFADSIFGSVGMAPAEK